MTEELIIKITHIITGLGCVVFSIYNMILTSKNRKLQSKLDSLKYWIAAIDIEDFQVHDKKYVIEARKILNKD